MLRVRIGTTLLLVAIVAVGIGWSVEARRAASLEARWYAIQNELLKRRVDRAAAQSLAGSESRAGTRRQTIAAAWASVEEPEEAAGRREIAGSWGIRRWESFGVRRPIVAGAGYGVHMILRPDGTDWTPFDRYGVAGAAASFRVDPRTSPARIDRTTDDPTRPIVKGIYRLDGDTLTICWARPGDPRPSSFEPGPDVDLVVYRLFKK